MTAQIFALRGEAVKRACAPLEELQSTIEGAVRRSLPYLAQQKIPVTATIRAGAFDAIVGAPARHTTWLRAEGAHGGGTGAIVLDEGAIALAIAGTLGGKGEPPALGEARLTAAQYALATRFTRGLAAVLDDVLGRIGTRLTVTTDAPPPAGVQVACEIALGESARIVLLLAREALAGSGDAVPKTTAAIAIADVDLELVVDLGSVRIPLSKLAALRVGDVLPLPIAVDSQARLHVGGRSLFAGKPTTAGTQIALEITRHAA